MPVIEARRKKEISFEEYQELYCVMLGEYFKIRLGGSVETKIATIP